MVSFRIDNEITLREFDPGDAEDVYATAISDYHHLAPFVDWISPDYSIVSARDFVDRSIAGWLERRSLALGLFRNASFIGATGFVSFDWHAKKTEIGYWIKRAEEGKGIVTNACRGLIDFAFNDLELNRIEIRCAAQNCRSSAVPQRLNFEREGLLREAEYRGGRFHDYEIYGLLAREWQSGNTNL